MTDTYFPTTGERLKLFVFFFTASRTHFFIQPEGLWQIMCQGFMMWDVIGPPSWWSKCMCISQWHPHICLAAEEHAGHDVSRSHLPNSRCNFVHLQMQRSSKHPSNFTVIEWLHFHYTQSWLKSATMPHANMYSSQVKLIRDAQIWHFQSR